MEDLGMLGVVFAGDEIADQVKQIFTDATGVPMVGLLTRGLPNELLTFHKSNGPTNDLIEMRWAVKSARVVARTLEEIKS